MAIQGGGELPTPTSTRSRSNAFWERQTRTACGSDVSSCTLFFFCLFQTVGGEGTGGKGREDWRRSVQEHNFIGRPCSWRELDTKGTSHRRSLDNTESQNCLKAHSRPSVFVFWVWKTALVFSLQKHNSENFLQRYSSLRQDNLRVPVGSDNAHRGNNRWSWPGALKREEINVCLFFLPLSHMEEHSSPVDLLHLRVTRFNIGSNTEPCVLQSVSK